MQTILLNNNSPMSTTNLMHNRSASVTRLIVIICFVTAIGMWSIGCSEPEPSSKIEKSKSKVEEKKIKFEDLIFGDEDLDDSSSYDKPRLQFCTIMHGKRNIISIKVDGTDLRRVLHPDLLYAEGGGKTFDKPFVRSPNNRYLILSMDSTKGIDKRLYDLKTKSMKVIARGGFKPSFQWTPDSKMIVFYMDGDMWEYHIESEELKKRNTIYSRAFFITNNNDIVGIKDGEYAIYDFSGKLKQKVELLDKSIQKKKGYNDWAVSPNGKVIAYKGRSTHLFKVPNQEVFFVMEKRVYNGDFLNKNIFYYEEQGKRGVFELNLENKKHTELFYHRIDYTGLTVYNRI